MEQKATIRIGKISSIDYATGKARIVYEDRDNTVTVELPIINVEDSGLIREKDSVLVAHLSNGTANGIVLGRFHANSNPPVEGMKDKYRKEFSRDDIAYEQYAKKIFKLEAPRVFVKTEQGEEEIVPKLINHEKKIKACEKMLTELLAQIEAQDKRITELGG